MTLKEELYSACYNFTESRLIAIQNSIKNIEVALTSETKSSAGDKHETGRAMLQLEREKAGHQLAEIQKTLGVLTKIDINISNEKIGLGSIVYTSKANYFIAISAGKIGKGSHEFFAISLDTPIGQLLKGRKENDRIKFRDESILIESIT